MRKLIRRFFGTTRKKTVIDKNYLAEKENARALIYKRLAIFARICGVKYTRVAIRNQKSRWGSCSSKGGLNFNYKLAFLPVCLLDYVIVHELSHLKEMNHGPRFWRAVEEVLPGYRNNIRDLRELEKNSGMNFKLLNEARSAHTCEYCDRFKNSCN